jgi:MFS family permease
MGIWAFFLFPLVETRSLLWITVAIGVGIGAIALSYGPLAAMFAELFSTHLRYSAVSLAYQVSAIVGGGMGPIIAAALYARYHTNFWLSVFISSACAMSLACVSMLKETYDKDLVEHPEPTVA